MMCVGCGLSCCGLGCRHRRRRATEKESALPNSCLRVRDAALVWRSKTDGPSGFEKWARSPADHSDAVAQVSCHQCCCSAHLLLGEISTLEWCDQLPFSRINSKCWQESRWLIEGDRGLAANVGMTSRGSAKAAEAATLFGPDTRTCVYCEVTSEQAERQQI